MKRTVCLYNGMGGILTPIEVVTEGKEAEEAVRLAVIRGIRENLPIGYHYDNDEENQKILDFYKDEYEKRDESVDEFFSNYLGYIYLDLSEEGIDPVYLHYCENIRIEDGWGVYHNSYEVVETYQVNLTIFLQEEMDELKKHLDELNIKIVKETDEFYGYDVRFEGSAESLARLVVNVLGNKKDGQLLHNIQSAFKTLEKVGK